MAASKRTSRRQGEALIDARLERVSRDLLERHSDVVRKHRILAINSA